MAPCASRSVAVMVVTLLTSSTASAATLGRYTYTLLDVAGGSSTQAQAVNGMGQVAGSYEPNCVATPCPHQVGGFVWTKGVYQTFVFDVPAFLTSASLYITGISDAGIVTGNFDYNYGQDEGSEFGFTFNTHDHRLNQTKVMGMTAFPIINDSGVQVGSYQGVGYSGGFSREHGTVSILPKPGANVAVLSVTALSKTGEIGGQYFLQTVRGIIGFTYQNGKYTKFTIPGHVLSGVTGLNSAGSIVGDFSQDRQGLQYSFLKNAGSSVILAYPGAMSTTAIFPVTDNQVVGNFATTQQFYVSTGYNYVSGAYYPISITGSGTTTINAANESGTFVGAYTDTTYGISHGFVATCAGGAAACSN